MSLLSYAQKTEYCFHFLFTASLVSIHSFYYKDQTFSHSPSKIRNPLKYIQSILVRMCVLVCVRVPVHDCICKLYTQPLFSRQNGKRVAKATVF